MKATCTERQRKWHHIAAPAVVCIVTTGYAALTTPTWWIIAAAFAAIALCIVGAATGDFRFVGWSGAASVASCAASLVENRPVHWAEPTLMCVGILAMLEIGQIVCIMRTREVNPSSFIQLNADDGSGADADGHSAHHDATLKTLLPSAALRLTASAAASTGLTRLYLASAISGALRDSDAFVMMLLGAVAAGACMYWLVRVSIQDFRV